ncbi:Hypothetical predicted protein [Octopus vulgaris]|uniref:Uncharacterized protein n=1 Tax=Octopus vulgaris TaxID=6645 RepID=A0AA36EX70_OCTVU|nr:Hypothetical predicted protein [Octopus vulgaris]
MTTISESYAHIFEELSHIHDDDTGKGDTRRQAQNLLQKMEEFVFVYMFHLWTGLLQQFHKRTENGKMRLIRPYPAVIIEISRGTDIYTLTFE